MKTSLKRERTLTLLEDAIYKSFLSVQLLGGLLGPLGSGGWTALISLSHAFPFGQQFIDSAP